MSGWGDLRLRPPECYGLSYWYLSDVSRLMLECWRLMVQQQHNNSIFKVLIKALCCESYYTVLFITCPQLVFLFTVD